jgi:hypothetical protein
LFVFILFQYEFFPLPMSKMIPGLVRSIGRTTNWSIICTHLNLVKN